MVSMPIGLDFAEESITIDTPEGVNAKGCQPKLDS